jgi:hypothetical protein
MPPYINPDPGAKYFVKFIRLKGDILSDDHASRMDI